MVALEKASSRESIEQRRVRLTTVRRAIERARLMWKDHPDREAQHLLQSALCLIDESCTRNAE